MEHHVAQHASRVADLLQGRNLGRGRDILAAALPCVNSYLVARSVAVVFRSVCVARSVGVPDDGSPFGLPVCTCCTSQVPAHQTYVGAHLTRRAYLTRTDAVTDTWGRCTCTDMKRWPRLCVVKLSMSRQAWISLPGIAPAVDARRHTDAFGQCGLAVF